MHHAVRALLHRCGGEAGASAVWGSDAAAAPPLLIFSPASMGQKAPARRSQVPGPLLRQALLVTCSAVFPRPASHMPTLLPPTFSYPFFSRPQRWFYLNRSSTRCGRLFEAWCDRMGVPLGAVKFLYQGSRVFGADTPADLQVGWRGDGGCRRMQRG